MFGFVWKIDIDYKDLLSVPFTKLLTCIYVFLHENINLF